ncbi:MAG: hypothetical protein GDA51_11880 [Ekhidna sp.]|nr:hypothetical protein [Ekhidna sp.]
MKNIFLDKNYIILSLIMGLSIFVISYFFNLYEKKIHSLLLNAFFFTTLSHFSLPYILKYGGDRLASTVVYQPEDENLIFDSGSTHFKRWENVGGKLFLTDRRLIFKSHKLNIQNHEQIFNLNKITKITASNRNRLSFEYEGQIEKFIVSNPDKWSKLLTNV